MARDTKAALRKRVILAARAYGISNVLFRNAIAAQLDLNATDMECLGLLFHQGLSSPSELAAHTGLSSGATTAMLDRLERAGLIARRPNPADRRGTLIVLVKSGQDRIAPWFDASRKAQDALVGRYTDDELRLVADFLERAAKMWNEERRRFQRASARQTPA